MKNKIIYLLIVLIMTGICSCGTKDVPQGGSEKEPGTIVNETIESITVVDQAYREVTVPKDIDSIALCYRVVVRFLLNLDQGNKIKGMGKTETFLEEVQPSLAQAKDVGQGVADLEAIAELGPDIFIHKASDVKTLEAVEKLGIPAIGIRAENAEDITTVLDILGKICGQQEKAKQLIETYNAKIEEDRQRAAGIKEKKTAIVMGSSIGKVADKTMLQSQMIELAGGINAAEDLDATELWPTAGVEQIFQWNPDYIFITGSESAGNIAEDILKDPTWRELDAVKNGRVYRIPAACDSWEFPGIVSALGIDYMTYIMYPELVSEDELENNVDTLYQTMYGKTFTREELGY